MSKLHAGNSELMRDVKKVFNAKIYRRALEIMNNAGEKAVLEYLSQYSRSFAEVRKLVNTQD